MDRYKIRRMIVSCLLIAVLTACDPGGDYIPTGVEVNLSVEIPGFAVPVQDRLVTNIAADYTLLVAVVSSNYGGGAYDNRTRGIGSPVSGSRGLADNPPEEGVWKEYSEGGVTYGVAFLRVHIPQSDAATLELQGSLCNLPVGEELIFMLAVNKQSIDNYDDTFGEVLNAIDDDTTGLNIGRGYLITSLNGAQESLQVYIMPTTPVVAGNTDLAANAGGSLLGSTNARLMEIFTCTGSAGSTYLVEIAVNTSFSPGAAADACILYIFDSLGRPVGRNPQQGNNAELVIGSVAFPEYPWADVAESQFFICVFGNHDDGGGVVFDKFIYEL